MQIPVSQPINSIYVDAMSYWIASRRSDGTVERLIKQFRSTSECLKKGKTEQLNFVSLSGVYLTLFLVMLLSICLHKRPLGSGANNHQQDMEDDVVHMKADIRRMLSLLSRQRGGEDCEAPSSVITDDDHPY